MFILVISVFTVFSPLLVQVLKEEHGTEGFAEQGLLLLLATLSRSYDLLQEAYKGQFCLPKKFTW